MSHNSQYLAQAYQNACLSEIEAIKPGNVHMYADGHGMVVQDFVSSAMASAQQIATPGYTLGERIFKSIDATWQAVQCNTNLGIVLLCAPLIQAALMQNQQTLKQNLHQILLNTTQEDAQWVFDAINKAKPAGLGNSEKHDVKQPAQCSLLDAMQLASDKDRIAYQYTTNFSMLFESFLPLYRQLSLRWGRPAWATTGLYLTILSQYPDSHLQRKYSVEAAAEVQALASDHLSAFMQLDNPKTYLSPLLELDRLLKSKAYNPGTSADLIVATLLLDQLISRN